MYCRRGHHHRHRLILIRSMKVFNELGESVESLWRDANYDEDVFPAIAKKALEDGDLPSKLDAWEVIDWTLKQTNLPTQKDLPGNFGDPPITIFNAPRFHIDVYFWLEGTTATHQHGFCGAFQVLKGSSIHSSYEFDLTEKINTFTEIGEISLKVCEILEVGDVQEILAGREYIHSLFHLDQPSATIVVRTHLSPMHLPQFSYHKPSLAIDPFFEEANTIKKLQAITALIRSNHPNTDEIIADFLNRSDFQTSFQILSTFRSYAQQNQMNQVFNLTQSDDRFESFLDVVSKRHEKFANVLPKVFAHHKKLDQIVRQRSFVTDAELRFFLALLLNVDGKRRIFELVKTKFEKQKPIDKILDWVHKLANTKVLGMNIPNALDVKDFNEIDLIVLEKMLEDKTDEDIINYLKAEMPNEDVKQLRENILARIEKINEATIFEPLLK